MEHFPSNSCPSFSSPSSSSSDPSSPSSLRKTKTKKSCDDLLVNALQEVLTGKKGDIFEETKEEKEKRMTKKLNNNKIDFSELEDEAKKNKNNNKNEDDPFSCLIKSKTEPKLDTNPSNDLSVFDELF